MLKPLRFAALIASFAISSAHAEEPDRPAATDADKSRKLEFFEKKIRPLLADNCFNCHSANTNAKGGLRVDDRRGLLDGGSSGAAIVPGDPQASLLLSAVRYQDEGLQMPPDKQLAPEQIADLEAWVKDGAAWPKEDVEVSIGKPNERYEELRKSHWAWQPLKDVSPPSPVDGTWSRSAIDRFVLSQLESQGLKPVSDADKTALIRRITFDLTGLPPTTTEVESFLSDSGESALATVVERLLASPAFGERWGRHWLDVARYGESTGSSRNVPYPHAWRYRDYVIASFNQDKPYDQFVREQIAGDLLPAETLAHRDEQTVATGFLAIGVKDVNQRFKVRFVMDNIDEQIDTVSRAVLGVTASCARCHDHKFDPIPTADYYALAGIFSSTDLCAGVRNKMGGGGLDYYDPSMLIASGEVAAITPEEQVKIDALTKQVAEAREAFEKIRGKPEGKELAPNGKPKQQAARQKLNRASAELSAITDPVARGGKLVVGVRDAKKIANTEIRIRGEAERYGPEVPRGFLSVVSVPEVASVNPSQSGRLELAQWLTSANNPLTSRVIVNRIWQHLMGRGIVSSVDNFGVNGDVPSHPELLDYLATEFVREGWSTKKLVRSIVLSRTYQLGSSASPEQLSTDPANRWLWRHTPRRLDAEEIRDAMLVVSGKLEPTPLAGSPAQALKVVEIRNNGAEARKLEEEARSSLRRSVYLPLVRGITPNSLATFDFAEQGMVTGHRETTTVAPQALYLLNDPFVRKQSLSIAEELTSNSADDSQRIAQLYQRLLGRGPTSSELQRALGYLGEFAAKFAATAPPAVDATSNQVAAAAPSEDASSPTTSAEAPTSGEPKKPVVIDPDQVVTADEPIKEEVVVASSPRIAAWASLAQAIFGSAEFRYLK